jgi:tRNA(fMet)-specific endonuclease VapC
MPIAGELLLDANAIIAFLAGDSVLLNNVGGTGSYLPIIAVGELYFGARKSGRVAENLAKIDRLVTASAILLCDAETASVYGRTKQQLKSKGQMIPENDVWIAAMAMRYDLTLVTRDHHFDSVDGLAKSGW